jgi:hypothetical protein
MEIGEEIKFYRVGSEKGTILSQVFPHRADLKNIPITNEFMVFVRYKMVLMLLFLGFIRVIL